MLLYEKELKALQKSGRFRQRTLYPAGCYDFATNDYLGLAHNKELHKQTQAQLQKEAILASKASLLVGGYHQIHKDFEEYLCMLNGFEDGIVVGSGFNANIALIEALVRKGDILLMDEKYHASGVLASGLPHITKEFFTHNDVTALKEKLKIHHNKKRIIVAVEGIYSMDGDMVKKEIFEVCQEYENLLLIVDEAHSSGVVGKKLLGVFDHYNIKPTPQHIKMGTLGKAYGSFGAYILASSHIISYLENRAKPLIYATALSLYDTLLAHNALRFIQENATTLQEKIQKRHQLLKEILGLNVEGLIAPVVIGSDTEVMRIKELLLEENFFVGAIRRPTVEKAILRVILRLQEDEATTASLLHKIAKLS